MKRNTINFLIDLLLFGVMYVLIVTGLLMYFVLPSGSRGGGGRLILWGWNRHDFGDLHFYLAVGLIGLVLLHIIIHWNWFCSTLSRLMKLTDPGHVKGLVCGVVFLVLLMAGTLGFLVWTDGVVKQSHGFGVYGGPQWAEREDARGDERFRETSHIAGQTTLAEAAEAAGISMEQFKQKLNLPDDVEPDEQLGRLKREYGFEIQDVRRIVYLNRRSSGMH